MRVRLRRCVGVLAWALGSVLGVRGEAAAQSQLITTGLGGFAGLTAGGYVSLSVVVARSRRGNYVYAINDVLGWGSVPILVGAGTGATLGYLDPPRLLRTVIGGTAGTLLGMGTGLLIGRAVWEPPEGKWAGAAIGAGAGLVLGSVAGILWPGGKGDENGTKTSPAAAGVPIGVTLRF
jgi:hypothetical protein